MVWLSGDHRHLFLIFIYINNNYVYVSPISVDKLTFTSHRKRSRAGCLR